MFKTIGGDFIPRVFLRLKTIASLELKGVQHLSSGFNFLSQLISAIISLQPRR